MLNKNLYKYIMAALFIALNFTGVFINIKMPTGMVHLGNFILIIGSILLGGPLGGFSGAIGMMLADIHLGYGLPSAVRTLVLKFITGLIAGYMFRDLIKKGNKYKKINIVVTIIVFIFLISTIVLSVLSYKNIFTISYYKGDTLQNKSLVFHWIIPVLAFVIFVMSLVNLIFSGKVDRISAISLLSTSTALAFNIFGEVFIKALIYYWLNPSYNSYEASFMYSVTGLPSTLITSVVTAILVSFVIYPILKALKNTNQAKYLELYLDDEEVKNEEIEND